jgi:hypothetical protein
MRRWTRRPRRTAPPGRAKTGRRSLPMTWTNALTGEWPAAQAEVKEAGKKIKAKAAETGCRTLRCSGPARGARLHPRADADPRLPDPGTPGGRSRPAGHARPDPASRARSEILRLHRRRHGPADLPRQRAGASARVDPADPRHREAHLLRHFRAAIHAHLRPRTGRLAEGTDRGLRQGGAASPAKGGRRS